MSASCSTLDHESICLQCGDRGFTNAFVYCVECLKFAVHRYCLDVIPDTVDEFVRWVCNDCDSKVQYQSAVQCKARDHSTYNHVQVVMDKMERKQSKTVQRKNGRECPTTPLPAASVVHQQQTPPHAPPLPGGDDRVNVAPHYDAPFPLYSDIEGQAYTHLANKSISVPRHIDWHLLESLGIDDRVRELLKNLGLERYARMELRAYSPLCLEFLSSMVLHDSHRSLTCRMMGKEFTVSMKIMEDVFGFPTSGARRKPGRFNTKEVWKKLTGRVNLSRSDNWCKHGGGGKSCLIKDPALAILHKFLAFNVTGKGHACRVNSTEAFLLWSAANNTKVCPTDFIWTQMKYIKIRSIHCASLCQIITGLAIHFGLVDPHGPPPPGQTIVHSRLIDLSELKAARFVYDEHRPLKHFVREYQKTKAVAELTSEGGPSDIDAPLSPDTEPEPDTQMMSTEGFQLLRDDLQSSRDPYDTNLSDFRRALKIARVVDERAAEHDQADTEMEQSNIKVLEEKLREKDEENRKLRMRLDMIERRLAKIEDNRTNSDTSLAL